MKNICASLFLLLCACSLNVAAQTVNKVKLDSLLDIIAANNKAMLSITIAQNGRIVYSRAIGYSGIESNGSVSSTTATRYRIGSVTKVFTSVMIFQLIEEGRLQLSTPLSDFFPNLPNAHKISVAQLLNHSSGLHNFTDDSNYSVMLSHKTTETEMLDKFAKQSPDFEAGSKHQYSNTNFILLGYIIEKLDHKPYAEAMKVRILKKIGLKNTYYGGKINTIAGEARSYKWANKWIPDTETDMSIPAGAGAIVSASSDLTKFMTALFSGKLINGKSLQQMTTIHGGFGMDLVAYHFDDKTGYGHNGGIDGFESQTVYYPKQKLATAYIANGVNISLKNMMNGILSIYFDKPYQLPVFQQVNLSIDQLDKLTGNYAAKNVPFKLKFIRIDNNLVAEFSDEHQPLYLETTNFNTFTYEHYGLQFVFDQSIDEVTMRGSNNTFVLQKDNEH